MFKFEAEVLETTKGVQSTIFDCLHKEFNEPGKTLFFDESEMSRPKASQCAKRMNALDSAPGGLNRKFHSGYHTIKRKVFVRVRPKDEIPYKEEGVEQEEE
jgi:hypothetical protein